MVLLRLVKTKLLLFCRILQILIKVIKKNMFGIGKKKDNENDEVKKTGFVDKMKGKAVQKMFEKQMKDVPEDQRNALMSMMEKNPEFFENIAKEIEEETKKGASQMAAGMKVMRKHQGKMQQLMMESMGGNPMMKNKNLK